VPRCRAVFVSCGVAALSAGLEDAAWRCSRLLCNGPKACAADCDFDAKGFFRTAAVSPVLARAALTSCINCARLSARETGFMHHTLYCLASLRSKLFLFSSFFILSIMF
jgi:hypothetical protein